MQLHPADAQLEEFFQRLSHANIQLPMGSDHHDPPTAGRGPLLEQAGGFRLKGSWGSCGSS